MRQVAPKILACPSDLGRPNFWRILQSPFFGFLGICMCGPEEDLVQGGRFLMEPERFIKSFNSNIFKIIL